MRHIATVPPILDGKGLGEKGLGKKGLGKKGLGGKAYRVRTVVKKMESIVRSVAAAM